MSIYYDSYYMYSIDGYMHVHEVITKKVNTFSQVVNLNIIVNIIINCNWLISEISFLVVIG